MIVVGGGGGGKDWAGPILSPGKKLTSQFLPPPPTSHTLHMIFLKRNYREH